MSEKNEAVAPSLETTDCRNEELEAQQGGQAQDGSEDRVYPPTKKVLPAMFAIYLVFFLVAVDRTIIGTAIPTISRDFNRFSDIAWYESGFLLPICAFQLSFGLIFRSYSVKWTLLSLTAIFELGSIVSAAAPTSAVFIAGRVISGMGAVGIGPGAFIIITLIVPLQKRPKYIGSMGAMFGISSILGPILGGYLTSVSWRWCFWINVPIGGVAMVLLVLLAPDAPPPTKPPSSWRRRILDLDPLGCFLIATAIVALLFALQLGGEHHGWSRPSIIALFVVFAVFLSAFMAYQYLRGDKATVPPRVICQRSVFSACMIGFFSGSVLVLYTFYLPLWFQVVQGRSPQNSGLALIPLLLSNVAAIMTSGFLVSRVGYYTPFALFGGTTLLASSALITTWTADISQAKWIGYQILAGVGLGLSIQQPNIAVQAVLPEADIAIGTSIVNFFVFLGGTVFVTASQALLESQLARRLRQIAPNLHEDELAGSGATSLADLVPAARLDDARRAYSDSMRSIWYLALALSAMTLVAAFGLEWKSVKEKKGAAVNGEVKAAEAEN